MSFYTAFSRKQHIETPAIPMIGAYSPIYYGLQWIKSGARVCIMYPPHVCSKHILNNNKPSLDGFLGALFPLI